MGSLRASIPVVVLAAGAILACSGKKTTGDANDDPSWDTIADTGIDPVEDLADDVFSDGETDTNQDAAGDVQDDPTEDPVDETDAVDAADAAGDWIVPPIVTDTMGDPCTPRDAVAGTWSGYRKDFYLPDSVYDEYTDPPVNGGRFHFAAISAVSGDVTDVRIGGTSVDDLLTAVEIEWCHVWPTTVTAGEPVWVAFHSRSPDWDIPGANASIVVQTTAGAAVDATLYARRTVAPITYVTTTTDRLTWVVHVKNADTVGHTVSRLLVNGRDVTAVAYMPRTTIGPSESVMWLVPSCMPIEPGSPWTVVVEYADAEAAVGVGRVMRTFFPIEAWPNSNECPFPGGDDENYASMREAGIDTMFMYFGNTSCGFSPTEMVNVTAPTTPGFDVLIADDFMGLPDPGSIITDSSAVAAFLTGDESDGELLVDGYPAAELKAQEARELWSLYPEIPVYNGAKTNGHVGTFAGMADIQGIDLYVAACAPHITPWGNHPPLRGAYDYLLNTRNNHMPLPTWMYAQGLHQGWNQGDDSIHVQPDPQEILVQAMSVVAAGGKGLMWFQVNQEEADYRHDRWEAISQSSWMIRGVRDYLREGDLTGMVTVSPDVLANMIRSREALVVPIIDLGVASNVTDTKCLGSLVSEALVPHWILADLNPSVGVIVPDDFGVVDIFEVNLDRTVSDPSFAWSVSGRTVTFAGVPLSNAVPVRLVVLAADLSVRDDVQAAMSL